MVHPMPLAIAEPAFGSMWSVRDGIAPGAPNGSRSGGGFWFTIWMTFWQ
jgi:hypothetical protein